LPPEVKVLSISADAMNSCSADADLVMLLPGCLLQDADRRPMGRCNTLAASDAERCAATSPELRCDRKQRAACHLQHASPRCSKKRGRHSPPMKPGCRRYLQDHLWALAAEVGPDSADQVRAPTPPREPKARAAGRRSGSLGRADGGGDATATVAEGRRVRFDVAPDLIEVDDLAREIEDWPKAWVTQAECDCCGEVLPRYAPADPCERWVRFLASPWYDLGGCPCKIPCLVCTACSSALVTAFDGERSDDAAIAPAAPPRRLQRAIGMPAEKDSDFASAVLWWAPLLVGVAQLCLLFFLRFMLSRERGAFLQNS